MQIYGVPADVAEKETHPIENNGTVFFFLKPVHNKQV